MERYIDRDLSWLYFNGRVLHEAGDDRVPLVERLRFLAIYSSNLDEFFRVRVATLRSLLRLPDHNPADAMRLKVLLHLVDEQQAEFGRIYREELLPALAERGLRLRAPEALTADERQFLNGYFDEHVRQHLQPFVITDAHAPFLENRALYFVVALARGGDRLWAVVNIPSDVLPRFVELPTEDGDHAYVFLDDVLAGQMSKLFPNHQIEGTYSVKLNRDAELHLDEESDDLVEQLRQRLDQREIGVPSRFLFDEAIPEPLLRRVQAAFDIATEDVVGGARYHNFNDLWKLPNPFAPDLEYPVRRALPHRGLDAYASIFAAVADGDRLLHFPYQDYGYVLRLFREAAVDERVHSIYVTLYRIASDSAIANALIGAARGGKRVTVFVEVKARFDEANNLRWAKKMEEAGVRILYSLPHLKVHAKVALIEREAAGKTERIAYFGTGNFNEKSARVYADYGLITNHAELGEELAAVFAKLEHRAELPPLKHLLVSQHNMQEELLTLLDQEIAHARAGRSGHAIIKLNNLEERRMIDKLYEASRAGVQIDLLVRGICCLRPELPELSENIRATRIVDRYLEHARIFYFANAGQSQVYLSSADWMNRNLHKRVEVGFPVYDPVLRDELIHVLRTQLADDTQAHRLNCNLENVAPPKTGVPRRAQSRLYDWLREQHTADATPTP
ncbi:MAG: polyphosphate kinase 1 [Catalinimonas sp.]